MCIRDSLVDGLKINDPANVYMIRDVASVTNVFIIGGDELSLIHIYAMKLLLS